MALLLASVVTPTIASARNTEEGIQHGSQTQQEDELVSSDIAASTDMSDMSENLHRMNTYRRQDLSDNYVTMNETKATQQVNIFLNNLNVTFITPPRTNHISVQMKMLLTNNTNSTDIVQKPELPCEKYEILTQHIDRTVYTLILVVGLSGNGMLLFIFIRHRKLRTAANVLIIHLAICDIINLSINAPLHLSFKYDNGSCETQTTCGVVQAIKKFLRCAAALAVITLIIQRFIITHQDFIKAPYNFHLQRFIYHHCLDSSSIHIPDSYIRPKLL